MVLVIWIILVLTVVAYSLSYEMRISLKMTSQAQKRLKAQGLARAGLAHAVRDLRNDRILAIVDSGRGTDTLEDVWATTKDKLDVKFGGGTYSVLVTDEERKLNVNLLQPNSSGVLAYLLENVEGLSKEAAELAANAVIDYKDPDMVPTGGKGSSESDFYTEAARKTMRRNLPVDWVFRPKNDNMLTLSELLDIPGITPDELDGDPKKEITDPFEKALLKKDATKALSNYLTVNSIGRVNINTCPIKLLEAILAGGTKNKTNVKWAVKIDQIRQSALRKRSTEGAGFGINNMQQLVQGGIPAEVVTAMEQAVPIGWDSKFFSIIARGEYGGDKTGKDDNSGVRATIQAMVELNLQPYSFDPNSRAEYQRDERARAKLISQPNVVLDPEVYVKYMSEF